MIKQYGKPFNLQEDTDFIGEQRAHLFGEQKLTSSWMKEQKNR